MTKNVPLHKMAKGRPILLRPGFLANDVVPDYERLRNQNIKRNNVRCKKHGVKTIATSVVGPVQAERANESGKLNRGELDDGDYRPSEDENDNDYDHELDDSFEEEVSERATRSTPQPDMDTDAHDMDTHALQSAQPQSEPLAENDVAVENGCNGCWEKERIALLQLKDSINFPNGTSLPSWEEDDYLDCCQWERVTCNSSTRRVIKLSLNTTTAWYNQYDGRIDWNYSWYLNSSILLPFESLQSLDLSVNGLYGFHGNEGIGILSNLSNLKILNLAKNILNGSISINGIGTLSNLSNLEELDLSWNALGNSILPSLNKLSNLKILNLAGTELNGSISINGIGIMSNLSNLEELHLEYNELDNSILPSLNKLSNLKILNLARNRLNGSISINEFDGLNNLKKLDLRA